VKAREEEIARSLEGQLAGKSAICAETEKGWLRVLSETNERVR
jgi:hypothetical protein